MPAKKPTSCRRRRAQIWLGRQDSNLRMPGSKPGALPTWRRPIVFSGMGLLSPSGVGIRKCDFRIPLASRRPSLAGRAALERHFVRSGTPVATRTRLLKMQFPEASRYAPALHGGKNLERRHAVSGLIRSRDSLCDFRIPLATRRPALAGRAARATCSHMALPGARNKGAYCNACPGRVNDGTTSLPTTRTAGRFSRWQCLRQPDPRRRHPTP